MSKQSWDNWTLYCEQCTEAQLENVIEKEEEAGRYPEAAIAGVVLGKKVNAR